ncbi:MAG: hypothetical protein ABJB12_05460 [Pseudomonadota bacterium]
MTIGVALAVGACGRTAARIADCTDSSCASADAGEAGAPAPSSGGSAHAGSAGTGTSVSGTSAGGTDAGGMPDAGGSAQGGANDSPVVWSCLGGLGHRACYLDTIYTCGPDLSHQSVELCAGTCTAGESPACVPPGCGDWKVEDGEECDDGNTLDADTCTAECKIGRCGDGLPANASGFPDACDDGNTVETDACTNACEPARCGDGLIWEGHEFKDTGYVSKLDSCGVTCRDSYEPATRVVALDIAEHNSCALLDNGSIKCWGWGEHGQLGICSLDNVGDAPGEASPDLPPVDLGGKRATKVTVGLQHSCAILEDGSVKCWGGNSSGELGQGDYYYRAFPTELGDALPAVQLGGGHTALAIDGGYQSTCALLDDHQLKCWGLNSQGQLGIGDKRWRGGKPDDMGDALPEIDLGSGRSVESMDAGIGGFVCAVLDNGTLKCWGRNEDGELGLGDTENRGEKAGEMGDALPAVDLGSGRKALAVAVGGSHACALLDQGQVKCWGTSESGALGLGGVTSRGSLPSEMGDQLPAVDLGTGRTAVAIAAGDEGTCALLDNATLKCWGLNDGALGLGDTRARGAMPGEMGDQLPALDLGTGVKVASVHIGYSFRCALTGSGRIKCWGLNSIGQLGRNDPVFDPGPFGDSPGEMGDALPFLTLF